MVRPTGIEYSRPSIWLRELDLNQRPQGYEAEKPINLSAIEGNS
jgi:hypothetical protein